MRSSILLTSALAAGALALPQGQLEKRQQTTVTVTVLSNPYATPAWQGPPQFSQTPNTLRPSTAPPLWTPPQVGAVRTTSTPAPGVPIRTSSSTPRPAVPTTSSRTALSSTASRPAVPTTSSRTTLSSITSRPGAPTVVSPSSTVIGSPISNAPVPSGAAPTPAPTGAPLDPGHTPGVGQATLSAGLAYQNAILYHHNAARANHNAAPLVWNDTVAATAAIAANTCNFQHLVPQGSGQGQNLFTTSGNYFNVTAGITESWYKSEFPPMLPYFGAASIPDSVFHNVGHLTQVLWKGTTSVGCVSIDCGNRMIVGGAPSNLNKYTVCNYYPAGNVVGRYGINVGRPISTTNLGSWTD